MHDFGGHRVKICLEDITDACERIVRDDCVALIHDQAWMKPLQVGDGSSDFNIEELSVTSLRIYTTSYGKVPGLCNNGLFDSKEKGVLIRGKHVT